MNAVELIRDLGSNLGMKLEFSEEHTCALKFDDVTVIFEEYENVLYLICELGSSVGKEAFFASLMAENYLGRATANAVLSYDEINCEFVLHLIIQQELSYPQFEQILDNFVSTARKYKNKLEVAACSESFECDTKEEPPFEASVLKV